LNDASNIRGGVGIEVVELANGEVIWSVLDTLRGTQAPLDVDEDDSSLYFRDRLSVISHYTEPTEELQMSFRHAHRSPSRGAAHQPSTKVTDTFRPETKVSRISHSSVGWLACDWQAIAVQHGCGLPEYQCNEWQADTWLVSFVGLLLRRKRHYPVDRTNHQRRRFGQF